jgi:hypothetical protein
MSRERDADRRLARRLRRRQPQPGPEFSLRLQEHLATLQSAGRGPVGLGSLVLVCLILGLLLLVLALIGATGSGPLG